MHCGRGDVTVAGFVGVLLARLSGLHWQKGSVTPQGPRGLCTMQRQVSDVWSADAAFHNKSVGFLKWTPGAFMFLESCFWKGCFCWGCCENPNSLNWFLYLSILTCTLRLDGLFLLNLSLVLTIFLYFPMTTSLECWSVESFHFS